MRQALLSVLLVSINVATAAAAEAWQPVGLGGLGGMFALAVSPLDPQQMLINCDMSAAYRTSDGGRNWQMIHCRMLHGNTQCWPVYHPTIAGRVYAVSGENNELRVSGDWGLTWRPLLREKPAWRERVTLLCVPPACPGCLLLGAGEAVFASRDDGASWRPCAGLRGRPLGMMINRLRAEPKGTVPVSSDETRDSPRSSAGPAYNFIATREGVFRSRDLYANYQPCQAGLPEAAVTGFTGGHKAGTLRLYATIECSLAEGRLAGGVYSSADDGDTWQSCMEGGLNRQTKRTSPYAQGDIPQYRFITTTDKDPQRVYVYCTGTSFYPPNHSTIYRSDDGGQTWKAVLFSDPRFAQKTRYNVADDYVTEHWHMREQAPPRSLVVSGGDPDVMTICTSPWALRTDNGGGSWRVMNTGPAVAGDHGGQAWLCNGLVVTSTWNYMIDPHQPARHYICYTDIGFARSLDAGRSWIWQALSMPWHNTTYDLACDPAVPGRLWAAMSETHDIPNDNVISGGHRVIMQGGVAVSDDFGVSWRKTALPEAPGMSVVLDPTSPKAARVLYASLFEKGVFKSVDGGQTWVQCNHGLGSPRNMRCCKLCRAADGTLFVLITGKKIDGKLTREGVGLYRSTDASDHWSLISDPLDLRWPKDFTVKPGDPGTILLSAAGSRLNPGEGGLYRTTDGGQTWNKLASKGKEHFGAFYHPAHPGWIYMTLTEGAAEAGLFLSRDDGQTWEPFLSLPFRNIQRVAFDPAHPDQIILTTFGSSILKGPAVPSPAE